MSDKDRPSLKAPLIDKDNSQDPDDEGSTKPIGLGRLLSEAKPECGRLTFATFCLFIGALCNLAIPAIFGRFVGKFTFVGAVNHMLAGLLMTSLGTADTPSTLCARTCSCSSGLH